MPKAFRECSGCGQFNHIKRPCCTKCGNKFTTTKVVEKKLVKNGKVKTVKVHKTVIEAPVSREYLPNGNIVAPAGKCPFELKELNLQSVRTWIAKLQEKFQGKLSVDAILYFVNQFHWRFDETGQFKVAEQLVYQCIKV
jgi:hypothetical protein